MMKRLSLCVMCFGLLAGCQKTDPTGTTSNVTLTSPNIEARVDAAAFLDEYQKEYARLEKTAALALWDASTTGKKEDFAKTKEAELALKKLHSNKESFKTIQDLLASKDALDPTTVRVLQVAELAFMGNQLSEEMLDEMVTLSNQIKETFNTFRAELDGEKLTNNDLLEMLAKETDSDRREAIWGALKQTGAAVASDLIKLTKLRNQAAKELGFKDFWQMKIRLQEHDPEQLLAIFDELQRVTDGPFKEMKAQLDGELAQRFGIPADGMMPWHYDNPFFQAAPPSAAVDLDEFYKDMPREKIVEIAVTFFDDIDLPIDEIVARSDLYDREGKDQHAFCTDIDRSGDVRTLCNIKPTFNWMDTMLHEQGHAVYSANIDRSMPFNLRDSAHILTTEAVAMLFGALGANPAWLIEYAGADPDRVAEVEEAVLEQRRREQLIFARWAMVMLYFEKAMYEDPDQDLNKLWWDMVEKYQMVNRPESRDLPDWAAKPHFTIVPVYYHNYMLGELFACQLRHTLAKMAGHEGSGATLSFNGRKDFGKFFKEEVFGPGSSIPWPEFVENVTGEGLTAKHFAKEVE